MQINVIEQELDAAYVQIGKKYVDYVVKTGDMGNLDIADLLTMMDPKLTRKQELEEQLIELEKRMKQNAVHREYRSILYRQEQVIKTLKLHSLHIAM